MSLSRSSSSSSSAGAVLLLALALALAVAVAVVAVATAATAEDADADAGAELLGRELMGGMGKGKGKGKGKKTRAPTAPTTTPPLTCAIGTCSPTQTLAQCEAGLIKSYQAPPDTQCASYVFKCAEKDNACTPQQITNGTLLASFTVVSPTTCAAMKTMPSVYMYTYCCSTPGCNSAAGYAKNGLCPNLKTQAECEYSDLCAWKKGKGKGKAAKCVVNA